MCKKRIFLVGTVFWVFAAACDNTGASEAAAASVSPAKQLQPVASEKTTTKKIVFVGQKKSCKCTRERIDKSWGVLEKTLAQYKGIEVQRLQLDVDEEEADRYDDMRPIMVAPGLFFMDENDKLVDMIQGEVTEAQIVAALKK